MRRLHPGRLGNRGSALLTGLVFRCRPARSEKDDLIAPIAHSLVQLVGGWGRFGAHSWVHLSRAAAPSSREVSGHARGGALAR